MDAENGTNSTKDATEDDKNKDNDSSDDDNTPLSELSKPSSSSNGSKKNKKRKSPAKSTSDSEDESEKLKEEKEDKDENDMERDEEPEDDVPDESEEESDEKRSKRRKSSLSRRSTKKKDETPVHDPSKYEMQEEAKPLEPTKGANKWWNRENPTSVEIKWETLEHNGVLFPPPYQPHGVKMLYDGKPIELEPEEEEIATFYAAAMDSDHVKNPIFNKNFFRDWIKVLAQSGKDKVIKDLSKCDFTPIHDYLIKDREEKKLQRKDPEIKKKLKEEKELIQNTYGYAIVDGYKEKISSFRVEPPNLFRGRGKHPKTGTLKQRVMPEHVTINIGQGVKIPKAPDGHTWKGIVHNKKVTWLAYWMDNVNGAYKYIWLASSSRFKGQSDYLKYEKARSLKNKIADIRSSYLQDLTNRDTEIRQRATAIWLIDKLALRVGNEKDKNEVADTVGCCSLRVEHLEFKDDCIVSFDFLGKDSMRYQNEVQVDKRVYKNLRDFCKGKSKNINIFDKLTTQSLNDHLKSLMPGLTAKVFRTYNASITLQKELFEKDEKDDIPEEELLEEKILFYNRANREVAILCNHQKTVSKTFDAQMEKMLAQEKETRKFKDDLEERLDELLGIKKKRKKVKVETEDEDDGGKKDTETKDGEKKENDEKKKKKKPQKIPDDPEKIKELITKTERKLQQMEAKKQTKSESKTVALGTSKINYMDPRITVAWCKSKEVPIEKIFSKALLSKFPWAMEVLSTWRF